MRAKLGRNATGALTVTPMPSQDSSLLSALVEADCLIWRELGAEGAEAGVAVSFIPL